MSERKSKADSETMKWLKGIRAAGRKMRANESASGSSLASRCSAVAGTAAALEADVQRMADMLAELHAMATRHESDADKALDECGGPHFGHPEYSTRLAIWSRLSDLEEALKRAAHASQKARSAVMDGKRDAIR